MHEGSVYRACRKNRDFYFILIFFACVGAERVEDLLCGAPSCSEACLFFNDDPLRLWLQSVQYDLQHDFAWLTDEADRSVVLALLQVAFPGKCDD